MKLIVLCEKCNEYSIIESKNVGKTISADNLPTDYSIEWDINNLDDLKEMEEISEDDVEVSRIKVSFTCGSCKEDYITIEAD